VLPEVIGLTARIPQADYVGYIRQLEEMLILALMKLGVVSGQLKGMTGVWIQPDVFSRCSACPPQMRQRPAKIASIGVKVDARGITRHGFALNVNPDMSFWDGLFPAGWRVTRPSAWLSCSTLRQTWKAPSRLSARRSSRYSAASWWKRAWNVHKLIVDEIPFL
jgi:lipoate-protein ligase B